MRKFETDAVNQIFRSVMEIKINISDNDTKYYRLSKSDIDNLYIIKDLIESLIYLNELSDEEN
ncbi:MAG: hypothetical protein LLG13_10515 [Bacteroidales bacterium]|nr:hypothetical protein [Bacteroidales bacterium]